MLGGEGFLVRRTPFPELGIENCLWKMTRRSGETKMPGPLPGQGAGAGGGSERRRGIGFGKAHSALCEAVDVWRFVEGRPVATTVTPAETVSQDDDDAG